MKVFAILALVVCSVFSAPVAPPANPSGDDSTFKAGETILIKVPLDTASVFNGAFPIDADGYVTLPVLGRLYIHNQRASDVADYISKQAAPYLRDIHVTVTPVIRLTLLGYWQHPSMVYVSPEASVWEACHLVGGPAGEVNLDKWKVYRGSQPLNISLLDEFSRGTTLRGAGVQSGDIFVIPVPNPNSGFWYAFRQTLDVVAQLAAVTASVFTVYLTYLIVDGQVHTNP